MRRRRLRRLLLLGGGVVVVLAVLGVAGVLRAIQLEHRLDDLNASIAVIQNNAEDGRLRLAQTQLVGLETNLTAVNSSLYNSRLIDVLDDLPVARQNIGAVRSSVSLALDLVTDGQQVLHAGTPLESPDGHLDISLKGGQIPLQAVEGVQTALQDVLANFPSTTPPAGSGLVVARVRHAEDRVYAEAEQRETELRSVNQGITLLKAITGGNGASRYLVAVANTAEMRGAGGMILSYGVLNASGGRVTLGRFGPIDDLALTRPAPTRLLPADFLKQFGNLRPTLYWRNATIMSDFTIDAPVLEAMYTQATGLPVNGVFQVDPAGLAGILGATGPVSVPGLGTVDAANVVPLVLNRAYVEAPDVATRHDYLTGVARASFAALTSGDLSSLRTLGTGLVDAAKAKHIILSFKDPSAQSTVRQLGFDGALPGRKVDFAQVTIQNFGGDKMDYYLHSSLTVRRSSGSRAISATVALSNTAPAGGVPPYIFGPDTDPHDPPGTYRGLITLYLPPFTYLSGSRSGSGVTGALPGSQAGDTAITATVDLPAGRSTSLTVRAELPPGMAPSSRRPFTLVPSPRVNPTTLSVITDGS